MAFYPITITAIALTDSAGIGGDGNVISGASVSLYTAVTGGSAITLYDNSAGANGSTAKTTDANGQVTVFVVEGVHFVSINGGTRRGVTVSRDDSEYGTSVTFDVTTSAESTTQNQLLKVRDYGLGYDTDLPVAADCLTETVNGVTKRITTSTLNSPFDFGVMRVNVYNATNRVIEAFSTGENRTATRRLLNGVWQGWQYGSTDFGIGVAKDSQAPTVSDGHDLSSGLYRISGASVNVAGVTSGALLKMAIQTDREVQLIGTIDNEWFGVAQKAGVYADPVEFYHSGNTNFNEFGGLAADDIIATGIAQSATTALFLLENDSFTAPTSITIVSTFKILSAGGATIATGVTPSLSGISSNKITAMSVTTTGLTAGQPITLRSDTASSKITVNF